MEPTTEDLDDILKNLVMSIPEVKAAAILSTEGLPIASAVPQGVDETRIAANTAPLFALAEVSLIEMNRGDFEQLYVKEKDGWVVVLQAGPSAILILYLTDIRGIIIDNKGTIDKIAKLI